MKNLFLSILFATTLGVGCLYAQMDTIHSVYEFNSPTANPWGLCWDGSNFWISDYHSGMIYKSSSTGQTLASIQINNAQITGIYFVQDTLWCLNSNVVGDTILNNITLPLYSLYQINKLSGQIRDSIIIISPYGNLTSGAFWGLCYNNNKFYTSFNGGYGPCLLEIDPLTRVSTQLCCTHLSGMTVINDSIWAVRDHSRILTTTNGNVENWKYWIEFYASSLTFDGNNLWIIDTTVNKIKKMETVPFSVKKIRPAYQNIKVYPNPIFDCVSIQNPDQLTINTLEIFDLNGKSLLYLKINNNQDNQNINISYFKGGTYLIKMNIENKEFTQVILKD